MWHFWGIFWVHILGCILGHVVPPHGSSGISILNLVHHQFWLKFLQKLGYLLWFTLINLINYGVIFKFFLGWKKSLWLTHHQKKFETSGRHVQIMCCDIFKLHFTICVFVLPNCLCKAFLCLYSMWCDFNWIQTCVWKITKHVIFVCDDMKGKIWIFFFMWNHFLELSFTRTTYEI